MIGPIDASRRPLSRTASGPPTASRKKRTEDAEVKVAQSASSARSRVRGSSGSATVS